jgi:DNA-binding transcriptional LysR family regulator
VSSFMTRFPRVRLRIDFSTRFVDLQRENYDVALRATSLGLEPGLISRTLERSRIIAVAHSEYLVKNGTPRKASDLAHHRCLDVFSRGELPLSHWPLARGGKIAVTSALSTNNPIFVIDAALVGHGIALVPEILARREIDTGTLIHVLPGIIEAPTRVCIVYRERELMPKWTRIFIDELTAWVAGWRRERWQ